MLNTMSKIRGQVKNPGYPQAEGLLGECMGKYGRELGEETNFGKMFVNMWSGVAMITLNALNCKCTNVTESLISVCVV